MKCHDCGGSDIQGTCVCGYDYPPEPDMSRPMLTDGCDKYGDENPPVEPKQICNFCGVDLFLRRTDLDIRMCVPCGLGLNHDECCKCVICDKMWLVDGKGSVCESCKSL